MILIVSHPADDHAGGVLAALEQAGHPGLLLDTALYPSRAALTQRFGGGAPRHQLSHNGRSDDLGACRVAWWRRPQPFTLHDGLSPAVATFTYAECHEAVAGLWASLDVTWINPPGLDEAAHHKPYQLAVATAVGLPIPRTLISNDPAAVRAFAEELAPVRTIYKTFLATEEHWRETRVLRPEDVNMLDRVRLAPAIFQEFVPAVADIRVTVVGERMFPAAITPAPGGYQVDYRMDMAGATFKPTTLPPGTTKQLGELMRRLGLVYGAIDLRRTPEGEHVFLEVNPAGEWLFVEERTRQPITTAMAELLIRLDRG